MFAVSLDSACIARYRPRHSALGRLPRCMEQTRSWMARHDWVFAVSAGLCASLVPGCAQSLMQGSKWVGAPAPMRQRDTDVVPTPVASNNASPYHQLPKVAAAPAAAASEPYVAPVYSVTPMSRPEVVVQPPPVAETSVMDRESTQAKSVASA